jgi:hypothetical protein
MKLSRNKMLLCLAAAAIVLFGWRIFIFTRSSSQDAVSASAARPALTETTGVGTSQKLVSATLGIDEWANALQTNAASRETLEQLRRKLAGLGSSAASTTLRQWLESDRDAVTGLGFKLKADGNLQQAPTLRTFLFDALAQLDPKAASEAADDIFRFSSSADEWAVALRAYAVANPTDEGKTYLRDRTRELFRNEEWRKNPSAGFLEAFDAIVYTHDTELTPELTSLTRQAENPALAHAAYLTLDRLVQENAAIVLSALHTNPRWLDGREGTRADFFARADVRDGKQRQVLENYLLDANRSSEELQKFAEIYPNANYMISYNLLTKTVTPDGHEVAARDRAALNAVNEWRENANFAPLASYLDTVKDRLNQFIKPKQ